MLLHNLLDMSGHYLCWRITRRKNTHRNCHIRCKKGKFLYNAVSSPQNRSKRFTLYFPDRPVHSDTISASLGRIQPYATINARRLLVHISTTVYSQVMDRLQWILCGIIHNSNYSSCIITPTISFIYVCFPITLFIKCLLQIIVDYPIIMSLYGTAF